VRNFCISIILWTISLVSMDHKFEKDTLLWLENMNRSLLLQLQILQSNGIKIETLRITGNWVIFLSSITLPSNCSDAIQIACRFSVFKGNMLCLQKLHTSRRIICNLQGQTITCPHAQWRMRLRDWCPKLTHPSVCISHCTPVTAYTTLAHCWGKHLGEVGDRRRCELVHPNRSKDWDFI
jgi:hypothetical protein